MSYFHTKRDSPSVQEKEQLIIYKVESDEESNDFHGQFAAERAKAK